MKASILVSLQVLCLVSGAIAEDTARLRLRIIKPTVLLVNEIPQFTIEFSNVSDKPITIVRPHKGSWDNREYPHLALRAYTDSGLLYPLKLAYSCRDKTALTINDIRSLPPTWSEENEIGWPFEGNGFQEEGIYHLQFDYILVAPDLNSLRSSPQTPGSANSTLNLLIDRHLDGTQNLAAASTIFRVEVKKPDKAMIARAIIGNPFLLDPSRANAERDYADNKWDVTDIRQSNGCMSAVMKLANNYRPSYSLYCFNEGRYLFMPKYGRQKIVVENDANIIINRFEVYCPQDAISWVRKMDKAMVEQLGFVQERQP